MLLTDYLVYFFLSKVEGEPIYWALDSTTVASAAYKQQVGFF